MNEYILMRECLCLVFFLLLIPKGICLLRIPFDEQFQYKEDVDVKITEGRRTRRSIDDRFHPQFYDLELLVGGSLVHIHLSRNDDVQTNVPILSLQNHELVERTLTEIQKSIYYQDDKIGGSFVVQFDEQNARNMIGVFLTKQGEYIMQTSNTNITSAFKGLHKCEKKMIQKHDFNDFLDIGKRFNNVTIAKYNKAHNRHKRATGAYKIELLIVCDFSIYRYWYNKSLKATENERETDALLTIRQFYAFLINGMDSRYKNIQTTSYTISIVFAGIIITQSQENSKWTEAIKNTSVTPNQVFADDALLNFSTWIQSTPGLPSNDHAMLFTKYDLTVPGMSSKAANARTFVGGMCLPYSQSLVEDGFDFLTITIASHILGHSLNASHDGDGNSCNSSDAYIMAASNSPQITSNIAVHPWIFSSCSTSYFTSYIDSLDATGKNCMTNVSISFDPTALSPYDKSLAGQIYDADAQCRHIYGNNSYMCREQYNRNYSSICTVLWCYDFASPRGCRPHIAGDGTLCASKKWCVSGVCTDVNGPIGNDNCLYGDKKGVLIDILEWTCADVIVNSPVQCTINSAVAEQCCSSCKSATIIQSTTQLVGTDIITNKPNTTTELSTQTTTSLPSPTTSPPCTGLGNRTNKVLGESCGQHGVDGICIVTFSACMQSSSDTGWKCRCAQGYAQKSTSCVPSPNLLFSSQDPYRWTVPISQVSNVTLNLAAVDGFLTSNPTASLTGDGSSYFGVKTSPTNVILSVNGNLDKPNYNMVLNVSVTINDIVIREFKEIIVTVSPSVITKDIIILDGTPKGSVVVELCKFCSTESNLCSISDTQIPLIINKEGNIETKNLIKLDDIQNVQTVAYSTIVKVTKNTVIIANLTVIVVRTRYTITLPEDSTLQTILGVINLAQSFQIKPNEIIKADGNSLKLNRTLDFEVERYVEKTFTLEVNSVTSQAFDISLTIKVLDVNDNAPKFSLETYNFLAVQSAYKDVIIGVTAATDADSATLNYTISPNNKLSIDAYGVIRIKEPIVQENYTATVSVDDRKFISSAKIYIELLENTNVNLNRTFANSIPENTNGRIILNVSDSEYENYQFTDHSAIRNFVIDRVSGEVKNVRAFDRENEAERTFKYTVTANKKNQPSCSLVVIGEIIITVTDQNDEKPVFVNAPYNATVKEGPAGSQLTMYLPISTTDKDLNPTVQYSVVSPPTSFSINQATGVITTVSAIDREATPTITITISAFDGTNSATAEITVNVIDINDNPPVFIGTPYSDSILENFIGELYTPVRASDKDIGKNAELTFDLISDGGFFRINQTTGKINVTRPLDRETNEIHLVIIYVRDNGEQILSASTTATFTVTDVNDNRPMFIQDRITVEVEEETPCQTPIITVNATDADKPNTNNSLISYSIISGGDDFQINVQTGQLYCKSPLDYENKTTFMLLIKAEDGGTNKLSSNQTVVINVKDINDNFPQFVNPQSAITIRYFAISRVIEKFDVEDKDSGENGKLTLTLNGTAASFLSIDKAGVLRTSTSNAPTGNSYSLIITAKDNGYPPKSSNHSLTVKVSIDTSQPISFSEQEINMNLTENREANTEIGNISYKVDIKQLGISLEYDIITADNSAKFSLNSQTGIITNKYIMDREEQSIYEFVVRAKNKVNYNQSDLALVRISVLDVNDNPPKFREANYFYQVSENESVQTTVYPITTQIIASDIDIDENAKIQFVMLDVDAGGSKECSTKFMLKDTADVNTKSIVLAEKIDYDVLVQKYCRLSIKAFNPNNAMMNSTVIVDINILDYNDNPPEFLDTTGNIYKVSIREDTTINTKIDLFGQLRDRDSRENGDIELSTDNCVFDMLSIDNKIQPRLNSSTKLDYESGITLFTCIIKAQDKGKPVLSATATLSITITDVNDNYPIILNPVISTKVSRYADINTNIVSQIQATDADSGENGILTYSLKPSEHASRFKIDPKTGNISINAPLTSVQADEIYIKVQVSDNGSPKLSSDATVIIQITDDNPKPYFDQPTPITIVEHSQLRGGVIIQVKAFDVKDGNVVICDCTYRLDITRTDLVIEADTGIIKFKNSDDSFDREKEPDSRVDVGVIATDKGNPPKNSSLLVIPINIKDINDQIPDFKKVNYIFSVYQDAPNGTPIGAVIAEDKDQDPITFYSIRITEGDFNTSVSIDKLTGVITKSGNMSLSPNNKYNVEMKGYVYAKDSKDDTKPLIPCAITIIIEFDSKNNHTPNFEKGQYEFDLTWDAEVGYFINQFKATDGDEGNEGVISYSIESGNNRGFFHIGNDGRLTLAYKLDSSIGSENVLKRILILRATDGGTPAKSNSTTVIITISGQNPGLCVQGSAHQSQVTSLEGERNKWSNALYAVVAGLCVAIILMLIFLYKWRTSSPLPSPSPFETNKHKYFSNETAYSDLDRRQTVEYSQSNQAFEPPDPYNKISDKEMCI